MTSYQLKRSSRSLTIRIRVDGSGRVVVSAPPLMPKFLIDRFVTGQQAWIENTLAKIAKMKASHPPVETSNKVQIFGKEYEKKVNPLGRPIGVQTVGENLLIHPVSDSSASVKKTLETFLKKTAQTYIFARTKQLGEKMQIKYGTVTLRQQRSRWGSCSSMGNLNFNWRLVHFAPAVIDYVIVHELAHRRQMNHGAKFWELVEQYDPEYLKHRGVLKRSGGVVE